MAPFDTLANTVLNFVNWGITIVTIMAIWEFIAFATGFGTEGKGGAARGATKLGERLSKWKEEKLEGLGPKSREEKKVKRAAGREKTALLNEYIEEKNELELIKSASKKLNKVAAIVTAAKSAGITDKKSLPSAYDELKKALSDAEKEIGRLKSRTWRQERRAKVLIDELEDESISKSDINALRTLEAKILTEHEQVVKALELAQQQVESGEVAQQAKALAAFSQKYRRKFPIPISAPTGASGTSQSVGVRLNALEAGLASVKTALDNAEKAETQAYKDVDDLVSRFKKLWE